MKNDLESSIREYYSEISPPPDEQRIEQTIRQARAIMRKVEYTEENASFFEFFLSQFSFIRKRVWLIQFAILLFCASLLAGKREAASAIGVMSTLTPLIFLTWTRELSRAFLYETAEVELSTRFTLRQVVISRITIIGLCDLLFVTLLGFLTARRFELEMPNIFMFLFVPFLITAFGCLFILNHFSIRFNGYGCAGWCGLVMIVFFYLSNWEPGIYDATLMLVWYTAFVIALMLTVLACHLLLKRCTRDFCFRHMA